MYLVETHTLPEKNACKQCEAHDTWRRAQILPNIFNTLLVMNFAIICYNLFYIMHLLRHEQILHEAQLYARRTIAADETYATYFNGTTQTRRP